MDLLKITSVTQYDQKTEENLKLAVDMSDIARIEPCHIDDEHDGSAIYLKSVEKSESIQNKVPILVLEHYDDLIKEMSDHQYFL